MTDAKPRRNQDSRSKDSSSATGRSSDTDATDDEEAAAAVELSTAAYTRLDGAMRELRAIHSALRCQRRQLRARETALASREAAADAAAAEALAGRESARMASDDRARLELRLLAAEDAGAAARRESARLREAFASARDSATELRRQLESVREERDRLVRVDRAQRARLANFQENLATAGGRRAQTTALVDAGTQTPPGMLSAAATAAAVEAASPATASSQQLAQALIDWDNSCGRLAWSPGSRPRPADAEHALRTLPPLVDLLQARLRSQGTPGGQAGLVSGLRFLHRLMSSAEAGGAGQRAGAAAVRHLAEALERGGTRRGGKPVGGCSGSAETGHPLAVLSALLILRAACDLDSRQRAISDLRRRLQASPEARLSAAPAFDWLLDLLAHQQQPPQLQRQLLDSALCLACDPQVGSQFLRRLAAPDEESVRRVGQLAEGLLRLGVDRGVQERAAVLFQKAAAAASRRSAGVSGFSAKLAPAARRLLMAECGRDPEAAFLAANLRALLRSPADLAAAADDGDTIGRIADKDVDADLDDILGGDGEEESEVQSDEAAKLASQPAVN